MDMFSLNQEEDSDPIREASSDHEGMRYCTITGRLATDRCQPSESLKTQGFEALDHHILEM